MSEIAVQLATSAEYVPETSEFIRWAQSVLKEEKTRGEVTIRIVDKAEIHELNHKYRKKNKPTNVLAFTYENPAIKDLPDILGDIVICAEVVKNEAKEQGIKIKKHFAHMTVHGLLHLLGYDHIKEREAEKMQKQETYYLQKLKI